MGESPRSIKPIATPRREYTVRVMRNGEVRLSAALARKMKVSAGDRVTCFVAESDSCVPELYLAEDDRGYVLKTSSRTGKGDAVRFYSTRIARKLLNGKCAATFNVGETIKQDGREYHTIIHKMKKHEAEDRLQGIDKTAV